MRKFTILLSLPVAAALAACVATEPVTPAPQAVVVPPQQYVVTPVAGPDVVVIQPGTVQTVALLRPGMGRVQTINRLSPPSSTPGMEPVRRVGLVMDDGSVQYVDTQAPRLSTGDRIEITANSQIRYPR